MAQFLRENGLAVAITALIGGRFALATSVNLDFGGRVAKSATKRAVKPKGGKDDKNRPKQRQRIHNH